MKVQARQQAQKKLPLSGQSKIVYSPNDPETKRKRRDSANRVLRDLRALLALVHAVETTAKHKGIPPAQFALAWLLAQKPWIVLIPGTTRVKRMEENIGAVDVTLTDAERNAIEAAVSKLALQGERLPEAMLRMTGR